MQPVVWPGNSRIYLLGHSFVLFYVGKTYRGSCSVFSMQFSVTAHTWEHPGSRHACCLSANQPLYKTPTTCSQMFPPATVAKTSGYIILAHHPAASAAPRGRYPSSTLLPSKARLYTVNVCVCACKRYVVRVLNQRQPAKKKKACWPSVRPLR